MNQREASKKDWNFTNTTEDINSGSLQRIADATEKMAASYDSLRNDRDLYKRFRNLVRKHIFKITVWNKYRGVTEKRFTPRKTVTYSQ